MATKQGENKQKNEEFNGEKDQEHEFILCDHCKNIINIDKDQYFVLEKMLYKDKIIIKKIEEEVWCHDCYYSKAYKKMREDGWTCDDDEWR